MLNCYCVYLFNQLIYESVYDGDDFFIAVLLSRESNRGATHQWRTVTFLTGCSLFKNTYHTLGAWPPRPPFVAAMLAAPLPITNEGL